eukprot:4843924-Pleurochrysis_carterae.AAC.4
MLMIRGRLPTSILYDDECALGGSVVRLRISTACSAAWSQKATGAPLATSEARVSSVIVRIARSATPQEFGELAREEFTGVVTVQRANNTHGARCPFVDEGRERGDEGADMRRCLRLVAHEVYGFES